MAVKLTLQKMSDWVEDLGKVAEGAVEVTLESGLLKDFLDDLCQIGGVAGALFKLGARAIPDPTPEQRIAARLHRTFLVTLDRELKAQPDLITPETWRYYIKSKLPQVAAAKMAVKFTWLSVFGSRGRK